MQVRRATYDDIIMMQHTNLRCLPENYNMRYYIFHYLSWPQLLYVQEDYNGNVVGYVLAKMDDEEEPAKAHGHITSLSVLRTHRKLGVASNVMNSSMTNMESTFDANFCSLHVRRTNEAALHLYQQTLQFRCCEVDEKYYVDDEDAFHMKKYFKGKPNPHSIVGPDGTLQRPPKETPPSGKEKAIAAPPGASPKAEVEADAKKGAGKGTEGGKKAPAGKQQHVDPAAPAGNATEATSKDAKKKPAAKKGS